MATAGMEFDLARGVSLAGAAFKAYCEPKPVHSFEDFLVSDTTVVVMDKSFLAQSFHGVLEVQLKSAQNLPPGVPGELLGEPNAYAVVSLARREGPGEHTAWRTRPVRFTSDDISRSPTWDPTKPAMLFPVRSVEEDELRIELYDEAPSTRRPHRNQYPLGAATLQLSDLVGENWQQQTLPLLLPVPGDGQQAAVSSVKIEVRLRPMDRSDPQHLQAITNVKVMDMSWDAPFQIGLDVVEWLRRGAYDKVTWKYLKDVMEATGARLGDLQPVAFIECRGLMTEAWVFRNVEDRRVVVSFRGTNESGDWLINLRTLPMPDISIRPSNVPGPGGLDPLKIRVHQGFLDAYMAVRAAVRWLVDKVIEGCDPWRVEVTGHSLGGALATLAAYDIVWDKRERDTRLQEGPTISKVSMVTFGEPRVGNAAFARDFNAMLPDAWRVHNTNDIVTSVPFSFGFWNFTHVGKDVRPGWLNKPTVANREVERWLPLKLLSTTPISSHLEFRYQDTLLQWVRRWVADYSRKQQ